MGGGKWGAVTEWIATVGRLILLLDILQVKCSPHTPLPSHLFFRSLACQPPAVSSIFISVRAPCVSTMQWVFQPWRCGRQKQQVNQLSSLCIMLPPCQGLEEGRFKELATTGIIITHILGTYIHVEIPNQSTGWCRPAKKLYPISLWISPKLFPSWTYRA